MVMLVNLYQELDLTWPDVHYCKLVVVWAYVPSIIVVNYITNILATSGNNNYTKILFSNHFTSQYINHD